MQDNSPLEGLVPLADYFTERTNLFPARNSGVWYTRKHKPELVKAGALIMVADRWMAVPDKMDSCVLQIGMRAAEKAIA
jgi:hypothetical protein